MNEWHDAACPVAVGYAPGLMEKLSGLAVDGLLALPRVGLGVGGLLLGIREGERTAIHDSVELPCSHAAGPSFRLTGEEVEHARSAVREASTTVAGMTVVGFYCSKTRFGADLNEHDTELFRELCPEAWQIALVIWPSTTEPTRMAVGVRSADGALAMGARLVPGVTPEPVPVPEIQPEPEPASEPFHAPVLRFTIPPPLPWWKRAGGFVMALAILAACGTAYVTRFDWLPRPPLDLKASESDGRLTLRWNRESVAGLDHASLTVTDGDKPLTVPLSGSQLELGVLRYDRKSPRLTAELKAGIQSERVTFPSQ